MSHFIPFVRGLAPRVQRALVGVVWCATCSLLGQGLEPGGAGTLSGWGDDSAGQAVGSPGLGSVTLVAAGGKHTVALRSNGTVVAWGDNTSGQATVPSNLTGVTALAAGFQHSVVLRDTGTVVVWGSNADHQKDVPTGLSGVTAIAAGDSHTAALLGNGTVVSWGYNADGQTNVPNGMTGVTAIAAGAAHTLVIKSDGTVTAWGNNGSGQSAVPTSLKSVVAIAAGGNHSVAVLSDGSVTAWGSDSYGQCTVPSTATNVVAVAAGGNYTLALRQDGKVVAWGDTGSGQTAMPLLVGVSSITAGYAHALAVVRDPRQPFITRYPRSQVVNLGADVRFSVVATGNATLTYQWKTNGVSIVGATGAELVVPEVLAGQTADYTVVVSNGAGSATSRSASLSVIGPVVAWGGNASGQITVPGDLSGVTAVAGGGYHSVALLSNGTVRAWGDNSHGQTNVPQGLTAVAAIRVGFLHTVALLSDGTVRTWGENGDGQSTVPANLTRVVAVAAGGFHTLAVKSDGSVRAWGYNGSGQVTVPTDVGFAVGAAAGNAHTVVVRNDGTVRAWGDNSHGQTNVPVGLTGVVAVAAGDHHSAALKSDGTVVAWGGNDTGQTTVPVGLRGVVSLAVAGSQTIAHKEDGTLVAWGDNFYGQGVLPVGLGRVVSVGVGQTHVVALVSDDRVPFITAQPADTAVVAGFEAVLKVTAAGKAPLNYQWYKGGSAVVGAQGPELRLANAASAVAGNYTVVVSSSYGTATSRQVALAVTDPLQVVVWGDSTYGQRSVPGNLGVVSSVVAGADHTAAVRLDGSVVAWGRDDAGQSTVPGDIGTVTSLALGYSHTVALRSDGTVRAWGASNLGQTTVPANLAGVTRVSAGNYHTVALRSTGSVVVWGDNSRGQTTVPSTATGVVAIAAGGDHTLALLSNGTVVAWGDNSAGQVSVPYGLTGVVDVSAGQAHSAALLADGTVMAWGRSVEGQVAVPASLSGVTAIAAGAYHTMALRADGTVVAWGDSTRGQADVPNGLTHVAGISAGLFHSVARLRDVRQPFIALQPQDIRVFPGTIATLSVNVTGNGPLSYQWRRNGLDIAGATGTTLDLLGPVSADAAAYTVFISNAYGSVTSRETRLDFTPPGSVLVWDYNAYGQATVPSGLSAVNALAVGGNHVIALKSDGTVRSWGRNDSGQATVPGTLAGVRSVAAGFAHSLALKTDGTVVAWGQNLDGQTTVPAGLTAVAGIAAGHYHSVAVRSNGTVVAWGYNGHGQTTVPTGLATAVAVAAGEGHTLALKSDGTVVAWGYNRQQQTTVPPDLTGVVAVSAGEFHSLALRSDGTVVAWGSNAQGQTIVPTGLTGVTAIAAGGLHSVALTSSGQVVVWGDGSYSQKAVPAGLVEVTAIAAGYADTAITLGAAYASTITTAPTAAEITYGQNLSSATLSGGLANIPGTFAFTTPGTRPDVGGPEQSVTFTPTDLVHHATATTSVAVPVAPSSLTITGAVAANKPYDGTTTATVSGGSLFGVLTGDTVTLGGTPRGTFASATVGTGIAVTVSGYTLGGVHSSNYSLMQPAGLTANIQALPLTITGAVAANKPYDGTTTATVSGGSLVGVLTGQTVTLGGTPSGTFASASVGTGIAVTVSGYTLGGAQAGNYSLMQPAGLTANIQALSLTISGAVAANKPYDGTTTATVSGGSLVGVLTGHTVTLGGTPSGTFASASVGTGIAVTVSGYTLGGAQAGNYSLTQPAELTANITKLMGEPFAGTDNLYRLNTTRVTQVSLATLLANDTDPEGAPLSITAVGNALPAGSTVSISGAFVVYVVPSNTSGDGSFIYTLSDGIFSVTGAVTVTQTTSSTTAGSPDAVRLVRSGSDYVLKFLGVPGRNYGVQYTADTGGPYNWNEFPSPVGLVAPASGVLSYTDVNPPDPIRLYRAVLLP